MISIGKLALADREGWEILFTGYNAFYERALPPERYDLAWTAFQEDSRMHTLGAKLDGRLVDITHLLRHASTTTPDVCYLQDLFTAPEARDQRHRAPPLRPGGAEPGLHFVPDQPISAES